MRKSVMSIVCMALLLFMFPMVAKATPETKAESEIEICKAKEEVTGEHICCGCHEEEGKEGELRDGPYCNHADPWLPTTQHSSMRYIRTTYVWNINNNDYDRRDYFQCVFCGYECFYVHNGWFDD